MKKIIFRSMLAITVVAVSVFLFKKDPVITNYPADDRTGVFYLAE